MRTFAFHFLSLVTVVVLNCVAAVTAPPIPAGGKGLPREGQHVDVAPYGFPLPSEDGKAYGVIWEDPRDIFKVIVSYGTGTPESAVKQAKLQYWQSQWPQRRIPRDRESGAGGSGWLDVGDWYNGRWRDADVEVTVIPPNSSFVAIGGPVATYTFRPINASEFPDLRNFAATYRTTLKLRLLFAEKTPTIEKFRAFSDSTWHRHDVDIEWVGLPEIPRGRPRFAVAVGKFSVFNGEIARREPLYRSSIFWGTWLPPEGVLRLKGIHDGIRLTVWYTKSPNVNSFDRTIVTVRVTDPADPFAAEYDAFHVPCHSFSFAIDDIVRGERIFIPDFGVLVKKASDAATYESVRSKWEKKKGADIYSRVFDMPEQTLQQAWDSMPERGQHYIPLTCEGSRQHFGVEANGDVFCHAGWIRRIRGKDTDKILWGANDVRYSFGFPDSKPVKRHILDGSLPIIQTEWKDGKVLYRQTAFTLPLEKDILSGEPLEADDTVVLMMRVDIDNRGGADAVARLPISVRAGGRRPLREKDGFIFTERPGNDILWMSIDTKGTGSLESHGDDLLYSLKMRPRQKHSLDIKIPFVNLTENKVLARLKQLNVEKELPRVAEFWRKRIDSRTQIRTPEPMLNSFFRAHAGHLLINTEREVGSNRHMPKVGTFHYGVFSNESCMMISDLDRRGYHEKAEKALETFLHYQGTVGLPGAFSSAEGQFYGAGGYEHGGYNQHHGWVLWCMGEHYWYTRDKEWLERAAPKIIKGCDWITRERRLHMEKCDQPHRRIERGLLPPGRLEDIGDWWCWLSTNVYSWWGLDNAARALKDVAHPEADRLLADAESYGKYILAAFNEAMIRSPVVKLRDGSYIPHIPSRAHRRGRSFGWLSETLEGAIHLVRCGLLEPWDERSTWIMKDFEDNLYLSTQFGYTVPDFEKYWFDRGGFSMQPCLLCSPIPYLFRDEIKHYLRAYFNSFAVCFFPDTVMLTEHPLPAMGDWRGDHYKASDESNSTYWLRLMFIQEEGDELYLARAIPRYWLADGQKIAIERAATYFGPMSFEMRSFANEGRIEMTLDPPTRNAPKAIHIRFRHPENKPITRVTLNGKPYSDFDPKTESVTLPPVNKKTSVAVHYDLEKMATMRNATKEVQPPGRAKGPRQPLTTLVPKSPGTIPTL